MPFSLATLFPSKKREKKLEEPIQQDFIQGILETEELNSIYPFVWKENKSFIESGGNFIKVLAVVSYPKEQKGNWLSDLKRLKGNISFVQYLEPANSEGMIHYYNDSIKNKDAELLKTRDPATRIRLRSELESAKYQLNQVLTNRSNFMYLYTYIFIQATSPEDLKSLEDNVQRILTKLRMKALNPHYAALMAFWSALPLGDNQLKDYTYQMCNSETASSFFPFDDSEICYLSPKSQVEGINKTTNSLVAIDYLDTQRTLNQNMVVIGTSGVGKSTFMVQKILRCFAMGIKVYIIDPENEYSHIVKILGGEVVHLSSNSATKINPLEIFSTEITDTQDFNNELEFVRDLVKQKVQRLKAFFKVLKADLTQVETSILDKTLTNLYNRFSINEDSDFKSIKSIDYPILEDFYHDLGELKQKDSERYEKIQDFYFILESYVHGSNSLFNGHTNVNINNSLFSFNLKSLQNEVDVQAACYFNIFGFLWDEITKNKNELIYLFIDEFHFLSKNPDSMRFFYQAYKRFRKYNAGAIAGTQQIIDVLDTEDNLGAAMIENSHTKVFFGLDNKGVDDVVRKINLSFSDEEISLLRAKRQGEALITYGSQRAFIKVELTQEELRLWNKKRYVEKYGLDPDEIPDYEERIEMTPIEKEEVRNFLL
ncbi:VirB4 family type IV secretion system protein [Bacillus salipaludis]|uniref:VirB4 family type IV secretion system protein n=1 Tax=Bacillus salipaludis TaxID=2547811 RepID=UPI002E23F70C|nr:ATP-binding protein [Bacillus salipaludis]